MRCWQVDIAGAWPPLTGATLRRLRITHKELPNIEEAKQRTCRAGRAGHIPVHTIITLVREPGRRHAQTCHTCRRDGTVAALCTHGRRPRSHASCFIDSGAADRSGPVTPLHTSSRYSASLSLYIGPSHHIATLLHRAVTSGDTAHVRLFYRFCRCIALLLLLLLLFWLDFHLSFRSCEVFLLLFSLVCLVPLFDCFVRWHTPLFL